MTDALDTGWGARLSNIWTEGMWTTDDLSLHINVRELRAVRLACAAFLPQLRDNLNRWRRVRYYTCPIRYSSWWPSRQPELRALTADPPYSFLQRQSQVAPPPGFLPKVVSNFHVSQDIILHFLPQAPRIG